MGPCAQIVNTLAPRYVYREYIKAKVYTGLSWVHGPLGSEISISTITRKLYIHQLFLAALCSSYTHEKSPIEYRSSISCGLPFRSNAYWVVPCVLKLLSEALGFV